MRNLGEFVGHIFKGLKTDPAKQTKVVRKEMEEEDRGDVILRRTTIEEIEIRPERAAENREEDSPDDEQTIIDS